MKLCFFFKLVYQILANFNYKYHANAFYVYPIAKDF